MWETLIKLLLQPHWRPCDADGWYTTLPSLSVSVPMKGIWIGWWSDWQLYAISHAVSYSKPLRTRTSPQPRNATYCPQATPSFDCQGRDAVSETKHVGIKQAVCICPWEDLYGMNEWMLHTGSFLGPYVLGPNGRPIQDWMKEWVTVWHAESSEVKLLNQWGNE